MDMMAKKLNYAQALSWDLTSGVSELWIIVRTGRAGTHMILLPRLQRWVCQLYQTKLQPNISTSFSATL